MSRPVCADRAPKVDLPAPLLLLVSSRDPSGTSVSASAPGSAALTEYAVWIQNTIHWGSENEILTLAKHYNTEIV
eukprot:COSAG06_NODE_10220_length_1724_cov_82.910154_3_plen_74_part_01